MQKIAEFNGTIVFEIRQKWGRYRGGLIEGGPMAKSGSAEMPPGGLQIGKSVIPSLLRMRLTLILQL